MQSNHSHTTHKFPYHAQVSIPHTSVGKNIQLSPIRFILLLFLYLEYRMKCISFLPYLIPVFFFLDCNLAENSAAILSALSQEEMLSSQYKITRKRTPGKLRDGSSYPRKIPARLLSRFQTGYFAKFSPESDEKPTEIQWKSNGNLVDNI